MSNYNPLRTPWWVDGGFAARNLHPVPHAEASDVRQIGRAYSPTIAPLTVSIETGPPYKDTLRTSATIPNRPPTSYGGATVAGGANQFYLVARMVDSGVFD